MLEKIKNGIYKIIIPFENIYTSSFLLCNGKDAIVLDSGCNGEDVAQYINPAIESLQLIPKYLVSSHTHGDHHGGIGALIQAYPNAIPARFSGGGEQDEMEIREDGCEIKGITLEDGKILLERFQMLNLKGHTQDSLGVFDLETKALISCDSLQLNGIDKYGILIEDVDLYRKTIDRLRTMPIDAIYASHEYEPLGSVATGEEVEAYLDCCERAVKNR